MIFFWNACYPRIHVSLLPRMQFSQKISCNRQVMPCKIKQRWKLLVVLSVPYCAFMVLFKIPQTPIAIFSSYFLDYIVLCLSNIDHDTMLWIFTRKRLIACIINILNNWLLWLRCNLLLNFFDSFESRLLNNFRWLFLNKLQQYITVYAISKNLDEESQRNNEEEEIINHQNCLHKKYIIHQRFSQKITI